MARRPLLYGIRATERWALRIGASWRDLPAEEAFSMTRQAQKDQERAFVEAFLDGLVEYVSLDCERERPDCLVVRQNLPPIGIEVATHHALVEGSVDGRPRVQIEAQWWKNLLPLLNKERMARPALSHLSVTVAFNNLGAIPRTEVASLVHEMIGVIESLAGQPDIASVGLGVGFVARADIARMGQNRMREFLFLPSETFPVASKHVKMLRVQEVGFMEWPPITCVDAQTAWLGDEVAESARTIRAKVKTASTYEQENAGPLWLLVVYETHGDLQSHVLPHSQEQLAALTQELAATGIDLKNSPFAEIWLVSSFTGERLRFFPRQEP